jgi:hypothetical protein
MRCHPMGGRHTRSHTSRTWTIPAWRTSSARPQPNGSRREACHARPTRSPSAFIRCASRADPIDEHQGLGRGHRQRYLTLEESEASWARAAFKVLSRTGIRIEEMPELTCLAITSRKHPWPGPQPGHGWGVGAATHRSRSRCARCFARSSAGDRCRGWPFPRASGASL